MIKWVKIPVDENYGISKCGQVYSFRRKKIIKKKLNNTGYERVQLSYHKKYSVHRLVAITFIPNTEGKPHVNHKDGNRFNNDVSNLEWCTVKENNDHFKKARGYGFSGEHSSSCKLKVSDVIYIRENYGKIPTRELSEKFKITMGHVTNIVRRQSWLNV